MEPIVGFQLRESFRAVSVKVTVSLIVASLSVLSSSCEAPTPADPQGTVGLGTELRTVGKLDGPDGEVFGRIGSLASDSAGNLFVLDILGKQLSAFTPDGDLIDRIGREGEGPGELQWPTQVEVLSDGRIAVLDEGLRKLASFSLENGAFVHKGDLRLPIMPRSFCEVDSGFYMLGLRDHQIVHRIDRHGVLLQSFGRARGAPPEISQRWEQSFEDTSATGDLVCLKSTGILLVLPAILPELRAFDLTGDSLWTIDLADYSVTTRLETDRGTLQYNFDPETGMAHQAVSLVPVSENQVLAQFVVVRLGVLPEEAPVESRLIDLGSGSETIVTGSLPRLSHFAGAFAIAWENLPYPRVRVFERQD